MVFTSWDELLITRHGQLHGRCAHHLPKTNCAKYTEWEQVVGSATKLLHRKETNYARYFHDQVTLHADPSVSRRGACDKRIWTKPLAFAADAGGYKYIVWGLNGPFAISSPKRRQDASLS